MKVLVRNIVWGTALWGAQQRQPITEVWKQSPQQGAGEEPLVKGSGGEAPLKLKHFWLLDINASRKFGYFSKIWNTKNNIFVKEIIGGHETGSLEQNWRQRSPLLETEAL